MYSEDPRKRATLLGSYVNPGHMLECAWFICHLAQRLGMDARISQAVDVMRAACRVGWDGEHGGFFQFVDRSGGPPAGPVPPELEDAEMTSKLRNNWDNKLWWPHSEALYALLLGYELSRDADLLDRYWQVHEYTFSTFPDAEIGEWIQIRARDGTPVDKVVALPVKDPFHITRAFILCIDVLRRLTARGDCPTVS
jgi:N-acylglucosamine 2-epimerase